MEREREQRKRFLLSALRDVNIRVHVKHLRTLVFALFELHRDTALTLFGIAFRALLFSIDCCAHNPRCDLMNSYSYLIG